MAEPLVVDAPDVMPEDIPGDVPEDVPEGIVVVRPSGPVIGGSIGATTFVSLCDADG